MLPGEEGRDDAVAAVEAVPDTNSVDGDEISVDNPTDYLVRSTKRVHLLLKATCKKAKCSRETLNKMKGGFFCCYAH